VREAMRQLATEGLIQFDSFRGAVVHTPTLDEVREVYEARLLLEPVVMRKTVERITPAEIAQARELQQKMTTVDDVASWAVLNRQFHGLFMDAARSPKLATIVGWLEDAATAQVALSINADLSRMAHGNDEHVQILDAVENGDADLVEELVRRHLMATVHAVEARGEASGDLEG
jgi:DNA-binding GntR family transcriptional regulator